MTAEPPPLSAAGPVTITRDRWGIGHVSAPDARAAFAAQGWLAASDRLWQMEWDRRRALGRWAEVAGPGAVAEDTLFRRMDLARRARRDWDRLQPATRDMTAAYADGVNAWLRDHPDELPPEFEAHPDGPEPWEPWHCVAVYQIRHFFMGTFHRKLWRGTVALRAEPALVRAMVGAVGDAGAMVPGTPGATPLDLLAEAEEVIAAARPHLAALPDTDGGSNSWAVHGSRTATGAPLLAGDPHRGIEFPNVYYQCHLACDDFDAIGLAFPGVPGFPHFGHNEGVAWCITHGMADDTDVFVEQGGLAPDRTEVIAVRGGDPVEVVCAETERGPIVIGDPTGDRPCLGVHWTAWHGVDTTLDGLWPMLTATDVDGLEAAMRPWVVPVNNVLSADTAGNISFQLRGRVVERPPANRWTPVAGDDDHAWAGRPSVPYDDLHHWRNPARGFLVTANNRTGDDPPYISLDFAGSSRHDRIVALLEALDPEATDVAAMAAIHLDVHSLVALRLQPMLAGATPTTAAGRAAQAEVATWNAEVDGDSVAATIYSGIRLWWAAEVARRLELHGAHLIEPGWPTALFASRALFDAAGRLLDGDGWQLLPGIAPDDLPALLGRAFDEVAAELATRCGPDQANWRWGRVHTMVSPHPLASARPELDHLHPPLDPVPGDGDTVRCASLYPHHGDRAAAGSVARYVFDLADWDRSGWVVPHGVSGVRGSDHDLDQRAAWLAGELLPMAYGPDAVAAVAVSTTTL
ncbi:MAG: penicillin acylase family protein [Actinomycetota bacterium]